MGRLITVLGEGEAKLAKDGTVTVELGRYGHRWLNAEKTGDIFRR